jgi:uncharacterized protein YecT (DUF1311 family)
LCGRDAAVADLKLRKVLLNKKLQLSACKSMIDTKIALWQKLRNRGCEIATEDLSGGSIRPLIQVNCITDETGKMIKKLGNINNCSQLNQITEPLRIKLNSLSSD